MVAVPARAHVRLRQLSLSRGLVAEKTANPKSQAAEEGVGATLEPNQENN